MTSVAEEILFTNEKRGRFNHIVRDIDVADDGSRWVESWCGKMGGPTWRIRDGRPGRPTCGLCKRARGDYR